MESQEALDQLWREYWAERTLDNRNALVVAYRPIVVRVADRMAKVQGRSIVGYTFADMVGAGMVGLIQAVERYNPGGNTFKTYAWHRIRGAIRDEMRRIDDLTRRQRRQWREQTDPGTPVISLETPVCLVLPSVARHGDWAWPLHRHLKVEDVADADLIAEAAAEEVRSAVDWLPETYARRVRRYYFEGWSLADIGTAEGISESAVCLSLKEARRRIRERWGRMLQVG